MLRSNSKSLGNHVVSPAEEKERLQSEGFAFACPTAACRISNYSFPVIHIYSRSTDRIAVMCYATITFNKAVMQACSRQRLRNRIPTLLREWKDLSPVHMPDQTRRNATVVVYRIMFMLEI